MAAVKKIIALAPLTLASPELSEELRELKGESNFAPSLSVTKLRIVGATKTIAWTRNCGERPRSYQSYRKSSSVCTSR